MRAVAYFGNDLSKASLHDSDIRQQTLSAGLELIKSAPGIHVLKELTAGCAAVVEGSPSDLQELEETLIQLGRGVLSINDNPDGPIRAALPDRWNRPS